MSHVKRNRRIALKWNLGDGTPGTDGTQPRIRRGGHCVAAALSCNHHFREFSQTAVPTGLTPLSPHSGRRPRTPSCAKLSLASRPFARPACASAPAEKWERSAHFGTPVLIVFKSLAVFRGHDWSHARRGNGGEPSSRCRRRRADGFRRASCLGPKEPASQEDCNHGAPYRRRSIWPFPGPSLRMLECKKAAGKNCAIQIWACSKM